MAREVGLLNARKVETLIEPGRHADGGNLYLSISENGGKRWVFLYRFKGKCKETVLGSAARGNVSLMDARKEAANARKLLGEGFTLLMPRQPAGKQRAQFPLLESLPTNTLPVIAQSSEMKNTLPNGK